MKKYKLVNNVSFSETTPNEVCNILANAIKDSRKQRLKIYYGDVNTGKDWNEEFDTIGYIGLSTGTVKIPLLILRKNSFGGGAILDNCIVKIKDIKTGSTLYQHEKYISPKVEIKDSVDSNYKYETSINDVLHGRHKTLRSATICANRIR